MCRKNTSTIPNYLHTVHRHHRIHFRVRYIQPAKSNGIAEHMKGSIKWNKHTKVREKKKKQTIGKKRKRENDERKKANEKKIGTKIKHLIVKPNCFLYWFTHWLPFVVLKSFVFYPFACSLFIGDSDFCSTVRRAVGACIIFYTLLFILFFLFSSGFSRIVLRSRQLAFLLSLFLSFFLFC